MKPSISLIIGTYSENNQPYLDLCLKSLSKQSDVDLEIVVVSSGDYVSKIPPLPNVKHHHSYERLHYPAAITKGYELCEKRDLVVLSNDDVILHVDCLKHMAFEIDKHDKDKLILNPFSNGENKKAYDFPWIPYPNYQYRLVEISSADVESIMYKNPIQVDGLIVEKKFLPFYFTMMKTASYDDIGGIDPTFKTGQDDLDFSLRAIGKGYVLAYCINAFCFHFSGVAADKHLSQDDREFNVKYFHEKWAGQ